MNNNDHLLSVYKPWTNSYWLSTYIPTPKFFTSSTCDRSVSIRSKMVAKLQQVTCLKLTAAYYCYRRHLPETRAFCYRHRWRLQRKQLMLLLAAMCWDWWADAAPMTRVSTPRSSLLCRLWIHHKSDRWIPLGNCNSQQNLKINK